MQMQRQFVFIPCLRHGSRVPRTGQRAVTSFAADSSQQTPGFDEVLEAGTVIGSATFDILVEEAVEVAADASRIQAEQLRILSRLPEDPQGSFNELLQDIQSREIPSVSDVMHRAASVMGSIQTRVDEQLSPSQTGPVFRKGDGKENVDENAPPEMPDPKELVEDVKAEAAAAREAVRKAAENKKI